MYDMRPTGALVVTVRGGIIAHKLIRRFYLCFQLNTDDVSSQDSKQIMFGK